MLIHLAWYNRDRPGCLVLEPALPMPPHLGRAEAMSHGADMLQSRWMTSETSLRAIPTTWSWVLWPPSGSDCLTSTCRPHASRGVYWRPRVPGLPSSRRRHVAVDNHRRRSAPRGKASDTAVSSSSCRHLQPNPEKHSRLFRLAAETFSERVGTRQPPDLCICFAVLDPHPGRMKRAADDEQVLTNQSPPISTLRPETPLDTAVSSRETGLTVSGGGEPRPRSWEETRAFARCARPEHCWSCVDHGDGFLSTVDSVWRRWKSSFGYSCKPDVLEGFSLGRHGISHQLLDLVFYHRKYTTYSTKRIYHLDDGNKEQQKTCEHFTPCPVTSTSIMLSHNIGTRQYAI